MYESVSPWDGLIKHTRLSVLSFDIVIFQIALGIIRALLYTARPRTCKLGNIPSTNLYRDMEQYPDAQRTPGILILQLGSPILYSNNTYIRERSISFINLILCLQSKIYLPYSCLICLNAYFYDIKFLEFFLSCEIKDIKY